MRAAERRRLLIAAHDPGGATALLPVIRTLAAQGLVSLRIIGDGAAASLFARAGIEFEPVRGCDGTGELFMVARRLLERERPDLVLVGSSEAYAIERALTEAAARAGVPSVCLLDYWSQYAERFSGEEPSERWRYLPDLVFVMDETARDEMVTLGVSPSCVVVVGHPHLSTLSRSVAPLAAAARAAFRETLGVPSGGRLVTFASETFGWQWDPSYRFQPLSGKTERTVVVLEHLLAALTELAEAQQIPLLVVNKLHPKNRPEEFAWLDHLVLPFPVRTMADADNTTLVRASDLVAGMTSMFLLEAACLGVPTLAVVPRPVEERVFANRYGARCAIARDPLGLRRLLGQALVGGGPQSPAVIADEEDAAEGVAARLYALLGIDRP